MPRVETTGAIDERPMCGRCGRRVDGVTMRGHGADRWTLTAHCHGQVESVDVSSGELQAIAAGGAVRFGVAFELFPEPPPLRESDEFEPRRVAWFVTGWPR
jgi:hypothetical protein